MRFTRCCANFTMWRFIAGGMPNYNDYPKTWKKYHLMTKSDRSLTQIHKRGSQSHDKHFITYQTYSNGIHQQIQALAFFF